MSLGPRRSDSADGNTPAEAKTLNMIVLFLYVQMIQKSTRKSITHSDAEKKLNTDRVGTCCSFNSLKKKKIKNVQMTLLDSFGFCLLLKQKVANDEILILRA